jgi:hypothetical protein
MVAQLTIMGDMTIRHYDIIAADGRCAVPFGRGAMNCYKLSDGIEIANN